MHLWIRVGGTPGAPGRLQKGPQIELVDAEGLLRIAAKSTIGVIVLTLHGLWFGTMEFY